MDRQTIIDLVFLPVFIAGGAMLFYNFTRALFLPDDAPFQKSSIEKVVQGENYKPTISIDAYKIDTFNRDSSSFETGDFDGDGDLDLIMRSVTRVRGLHSKINLYQFRNDGKGNFTLYVPESETRVSE